MLVQTRLSLYRWTQSYWGYAWNEVCSAWIQAKTWYSYSLLIQEQICKLPLKARIYVSEPWTLLWSSTPLYQFKNTSQYRQPAYTLNTINARTAMLTKTTRNSLVYCQWIHELSLEYLITNNSIYQLKNHSWQWQSLKTNSQTRLYLNTTNSNTTTTTKAYGIPYEARHSNEYQLCLWNPTGFLWFWVCVEDSSLSKEMSQVFFTKQSIFIQHT